MEDRTQTETQEQTTEIDTGTEYQLTEQPKEPKLNRRERRRQAALNRRYRKVYKFTPEGEIEVKYIYVFKKSISPELAKNR